MMETKLTNRRIISLVSDKAVQLCLTHYKHLPKQTNLSITPSPRQGKQNKQPTQACSQRLLLSRMTKTPLQVPGSCYGTTTSVFFWRSLSQGLRQQLAKRDWEKQKYSRHTQVTLKQLSLKIRSEFTMKQTWGTEFQTSIIHTKAFLCLQTGITASSQTQLPLPASPDH